MAKLVVILALAVFASIVLADPQRNVGPTNRLPIATLSGLRFPPPTPVPRPFRNPAIPPRRVERQIGLQDIPGSVLNSVAAFPEMFGSIISNLAPTALKFAAMPLKFGSALAAMPGRLIPAVVNATQITPGSA
uniref:Putative secreted protein n=1 Tax=Rhipicephalus microplus TaxID=6941 RepID=A0A6M2DAD5_RHIMP